MCDDFLQRIIIDFVKGFGVTIVLRKCVKSHLVNEFVCDWIGTDDKFYSLAVFYNETSLLPIGCNHLVCSFDNTKILNESLRVFGTKDDWCKGCWSDTELVKLNDGLIAKMLAIENLQAQCGDYKILSAKMYVSPSFGVSIWYECFKKIECLTAWYGAQTTVAAVGHGLAELVEKLGLSDCVCVVEKQDSKLLLEVTDE